MIVKKRNILGGILLLLLSICFMGCYEYKDINKITFVTSIIFDLNEAGDIEIYLDSVKPYRSSNDSSDKGKKIVYRGTGKTVSEAIKDLNMQASSRINFTQCKAYIFTENVSRKGIKMYMDAINKNQEFMVRPYMFVLFGNPSELLNDVEGDEEYIGLYINDLVEKMNKNPRIIAISANEYLDSRTDNSNLMVLGALNVKGYDGKKRLELSGGALFKDDVMVRKINPNEAMTYNFLKGNVESGTLEAVNPQAPDSFVTLEIQRCKSKTSMEYVDGRIQVFNNIKVKCYIAESQETLVIDDNVLELIEKEEESLLRQYANLVFDYYKSENLDIINVTRMFKKDYPDVVLEGSPLDITDINVSVDVKIDGSSITANTF